MSFIPFNALARCLLSLSIMAVLHAVSADQPNVICIIVDDMDKDEISAYGAKILQPNLDRLAKEGMTFHRAYVNATVCTPSRYTLATGRYAGMSQAPEYMQQYPMHAQGHPGFNLGLEMDGRNVGKVLADAGYATGWVGKFHLGAEDKEEGNDKRQAKNERVDLSVASAQMKQHELALREHIKRLGFTWAKHVYPGNLQEPFAHHNLEWTIEAALEFIETYKKQPFYLHFNTTLCHGPDKSWGKSFDFPLFSGEGLLTQLPTTGMPARATINERITKSGYTLAHHRSGWTWLDDGIGAILKKLDDLQLTDNTIVVFIPDHGSKNKASLFDRDALNVPLIIRYPKAIAAGSQCHALVQAADLVPTFFDYANTPVPANYAANGTSLRPLFTNPNNTIHESIYAELGCARTVITQQHKYIAVRYAPWQVEKIITAKSTTQLVKALSYLSGSLGISMRGMNYSTDYLASDQLYDLQNDPSEKHNLALAPEHQEKLIYVRTMLTSYIQQQQRPFGEFIADASTKSSKQSRISDIDTQRQKIITLLHDGKLSQKNLSE